MEGDVRLKSAAAEPNEDPSGQVLKVVGFWPHGWAAVASGQAQHLHHGLSGDRVGLEVARLELPGGDQALVSRRSARHVAGEEASTMATVSGVAQWDATLTTPTAPTASSDRVSASSPL